jgi:hypothetical protein
MWVARKIETQTRPTLLVLPVRQETFSPFVLPLPASCRLSHSSFRLGAPHLFTLKPRTSIIAVGSGLPHLQNGNPRSTSIIFSCGFISLSFSLDSRSFLFDSSCGAVRRGCSNWGSDQRDDLEDSERSYTPAMTATATAPAARRGTSASSKERRQPDPEEEDIYGSLEAEATANSRVAAPSGSGTRAPHAVAAAIPRSAANQPRATSGDGGPEAAKLSSNQCDCGIVLQQHSNNDNDELDLWEDVGYVASAATTVRRVLVSTNPDRNGGAVKADVSDGGEVGDFADEDRASPTSVAAGPGEPGTAAAATTTNRDLNMEPPKAPVARPSGASSAAVEDLRAQLHAADLQRQKMAANLRKKKAQLDEAEAGRKALEAKVADLEATLAKERAENDQLRAGLQKVVVTRDDMKNKLRTKNELLRELRADKDDAERRLRRSENQRATEQDLLANYRKLATHTGYFKWGKTIRVLEAALEQFNASGEGGGGGGNNSAHSSGGYGNAANNGGNK